MNKGGNLSLKKIKEGIFAKKCRSLNILYLFDSGRQLSRLTKKQLLKGAIDAKILIGSDYENALLQKKLIFLITTLAEKRFI